MRGGTHAQEGGGSTPTPVDSILGRGIPADPQVLRISTSVLFLQYSNHHSQMLVNNLRCQREPCTVRFCVSHRPQGNSALPRGNSALPRGNSALPRGNSALPRPVATQLCPARSVIEAVPAPLCHGGLQSTEQIGHALTCLLTKVFPAKRNDTITQPSFVPPNRSTARGLGWASLHP